MASAFAIKRRASFRLRCFRRRRIEDFEPKMRRIRDQKILKSAINLEREAQYAVIIGGRTTWIS